jgi:NADH dehydrogenase FAD-containing subunit
MRSMWPSESRPSEDPMLRIVILGGGFAGVEAARYLDRTVAKKSGVEVTLVSRENFTVFTPMLHEVAAGDLEPAIFATHFVNYSDA